MQTYHLHVINEHFRSSSGSEHSDHASALEAGMRGALQIGVDEICSGKAFFGAEITILLEGEVLERRLIAIGSSPLHGSHVSPAPLLPSTEIKRMGAPETPQTWT